MPTVTRSHVINCPRSVASQTLRHKEAVTLPAMSRSFFTRGMSRRTPKPELSEPAQWLLDATFLTWRTGSLGSAASSAGTAGAISSDGTDGERIRLVSYLLGTRHCWRPDSSSNYSVASALHHRFAEQSAEGSFLHSVCFADTREVDKPPLPRVAAPDNFQHRIFRFLPVARHGISPIRGAISSRTWASGPPHAASAVLVLGSASAATLWFSVL